MQVGLDTVEIDSVEQQLGDPSAINLTAEEAGAKSVRESLINFMIYWRRPCERYEGDVILLELS